MNVINEMFLALPQHLNTREAEIGARDSRAAHQVEQNLAWLDHHWLIRFRKVVLTLALTRLDHVCICISIFKYNTIANYNSLVSMTTTGTLSAQIRRQKRSIVLALGACAAIYTRGLLFQPFM